MDRDVANWNISARAKELRDGRRKINSLKDECIRVVLDYSKTYLLLNKNSFTILPTELRNDILRQFLKLNNKFSLDQKKFSPKDKHKLILALINKDTEVLDIEKWEKKIWADYDDRLSTMLEQVSHTATSLRCLRVKSTFLCELHLSRPSLDFNLKMGALETLVIIAEWSFADKDLATLGEKFPNLQSLSILIGETTSVGVKNLSALSRLKELRFFARGRYDKDEAIEKTESFYSLFVEKMPYLRVVGNKVTDNDPDSKFLFNSSMPQLAPTFPRGLYQLEHLHTSHSLPSKAQLPNLTHLHFRGPITKARTLVTISRYISLHHLTLMCVDASTIEEFLLVIGHQLTELRIESLSEELDMYLVLHLCPNLRRFSLHDCSNGFASKYPEIKTRVASMQFPKFEEFRASYCYQNFGLLKFLLSQPNIKSIYVADIKLGSEDLIVVKDPPRALFTHLKSFELQYINNDEHDIRNVGDICRLVLSRSPTLTMFGVSWSEDQVFDSWCQQESELSDLSSSTL